MGAVLGVALCPIIFGLSTTYNISGLIGGASLVHDLRDKAAAYTTYLEDASRDAVLAHAARAAIDPMASQVCALVEAERDHGLLTGSKGTGAVSAAYTSVCQSLSSVRDTLGETITANAEREEAAAAILKKMRNVIEDTALSVYERREQFRDLAARLRALADQAGAERVGKRLSAQFAIMESAVTAIGTRPGAFGERQNDAVEGLRATVEGAGAALEQLSGETERTKAQPPGDLLQLNAAVARYWPRFWPAALLGVAVDFIAFYFVALLAVSRAVMRSREDDIES